MSAFVKSFVSAGVALAAFAAAAGENDWKGRKVAFLGDSITDARHIGCSANYWGFLQRDLGLEPFVYGINGQQMSHVYDQARKMLAEHPSDIGAISVFAGTNDYNANVPLGDWGDGAKSFRGRLARVLDFCAAHYPDTTVWLLTPVHRGFAQFGATNVQPDETHANTLGLWLDDYVQVLKEAAAKWPNVRLVDLAAESGLYPLAPQHLKFFHNAQTDQLHPNNAGHARMAAAIAARLRTADATPLVQKRLAETPDGGTLQLAKDVYHFYGDDARKMWLDPSNNASGEKQVVFPLVGRRNVTIDGSGSTFVFHGRTFPFAATNCTGLVFRNFTVTTRYPSCAGFTLLEKNDAGFKIKFEDGVCPYVVENGNLTFRLDGYDVRTAAGRLSLHSLDRLAIFYLMTPDSKGDKGEFPAPFIGVTPQDLGNGVLQFSYYGDKHPKSIKMPYNVGERVVVNLEEQRYRDVFFFEDCDGVAVENVSISRFGGMGVVGQRSGNLRVDGLRAVPPAGERVSLTADIVQFINCHGRISIENCSGGWSLDDWINIHGNYLRVERVEGRKVALRAKHRSHQGFFPYRPGDALAFVTAHARAVKARAKVVSVQPDPKDRFACTVTVDADLASVEPGMLAENVTLNPDVTIRGNHFRDYPNLRLSGRGRYRVEGNRFERGCMAVVGLDLADYWYESGPIQDMEIRNNAVVDCGGFSFGLSGWRGNESDLPKIHGRILLEGNTFERVRGAKWSAVGVRDFVAR